MKQEIKQIHYNTPEQKLQELFKQHLSELVNCIITDLSMEPTIHTASYRTDIEHALFYMPEKRTFTYEGYTHSDKRFKLIITE